MHFGNKTATQKRAALRQRLAEVNTALTGDSTVTGRNGSAPMSVAERSEAIYRPSVFTQAPVSEMLEASYAVAAQEFTAALKALRALGADLGKLENEMDLKGAPWTPGRMPQWSE